MKRRVVAPSPDTTQGKEQPMKSPSALVRFAAASAAAIAVAVFTAPCAQAQSTRVVNGQVYWTGDPGPVEPGSFWNGGQYRYDPHHYLSYYGTDPQDYREVVYADHAGSARCVWRKRVVNTDWELRHPYLRVCRN
jgi:hypothetical protein